MPRETAITYWLNRLPSGDAAAAQKLWECYFHRLVGLARVKLQGLPRRAAADEEDVALSAFASFCRRAEQGQFPQLHNRDHLWHLLVTITVRKAAHLQRDEYRQKRGSGAVVGESALQRPGSPEGPRPGLEEVMGREPTPEFAALVTEAYQRLLARLDSDELRAIALWKMEGDTNPQIAARLGCAPSTIDRRLALIRRIWEREDRP